MRRLRTWTSTEVPLREERFRLSRLSRLYFRVPSSLRSRRAHFVRRNLQQGSQLRRSSLPAAMPRGGMLAVYLTDASQIDRYRCNLMIDKKCKCGKSVKNMQCSKEFICDKEVYKVEELWKTRMLGFRRVLADFPGRRRCCTGDCPECPEVYL